MEKITKSILIIVVVCLIFSGCGNKFDEPKPVNPMQETLAKMPLQIMQLPSRGLKMKAFIFNNIELTAKDRGLATWQLHTEEEQISWLLSMGHNVASSMNSVIDFGKWHHTDFMNQTTWKINCFDYVRDHEVVFSKANTEDFLTWMLRHNFEVYKSKPALTLKTSGTVFHKDAYAFGSGIVQGKDGATFICREMPTDGTVNTALGIYEGTSPSLLSDSEIFEVSSQVPDNAFSAMICKLETSISRHNQVTTVDATGFSGVPLTDEQTIWVTRDGRPSELSWFSVSHITKDGHHGLLWQLHYDNPENALSDFEPLKDAIKTSTGRFTERNWWTEDLHLEPPEFSLENKTIKIWSQWNIPDEDKNKLESGNLTKEEFETLWLKYVRSIFDLFDKFERQDFGPLWQRY